MFEPDGDLNVWFVLAFGLCLIFTIHVIGTRAISRAKALNRIEKEVSLKAAYGLGYYDADNNQMIRPMTASMPDKGLTFFAEELRLQYRQGYTDGTERKSNLSVEWIKANPEHSGMYVEISELLDKFFKYK